MITIVHQLITKEDKEDDNKDDDNKDDDDKKDDDKKDDDKDDNKCSSINSKNKEWMKKLVCCQKCV